MDPSWLDAADWNYRASQLAFFANSGNGEVVESQRIQITSCGFPFADFNTAWLKLPLGDIAGAVEQATAYFHASGLPFHVQVRSDHAASCAPVLSEHGWREHTRVPAMVLALERDAPPSPPDLTVEEVNDAAGLTRFGETGFAGFSLPAGGARLFFTEALRSLPELHLLVGSIAGQPVCTSALLRTGLVAGVYWVATLEAHRGRGLGEAITWAAVQAGRRQGCRFASLQASVMGRPVYERMGFETPAHYVRYSHADHS